ncbi:hypothetical protein RRG08_004955 [Elysia crispata]|uniref:Uncharacterized protein n=1 Tax=Elysia crispata TaxID=231223 RepID=A0AAE0ZJ46_9GAST|nr:hypothetical protein RRG08_004955 [Elysia crispata]
MKGNRSATILNVIQFISGYRIIPLLIRLRAASAKVSQRAGGKTCRGEPYSVAVTSVSCSECMDFVSNKPSTAWARHRDTPWQPERGDLRKQIMTSDGGVVPRQTLRETKMAVSSSELRVK